jgi:hypothetical protein
LEDKVLENALEYMAQLEQQPAVHLEAGIVENIFDEIPGILPNLKQTN